jgi:paraquat-inducible protein B
MKQTPSAKPTEIKSGTQKIQKRITIVWLLPVIALIIGAWMLYSNFVERDIIITIHFNSGAGLVAGKTQVKHKGVNIGEVKKLSLDENLKGVAATVAISRSAESALKEGTLFWVIEPRISFFGVSCLDTLVSGSYIEMRPGHGKEVYDFKALASPPPLPESEPGLHLVLKTGNLGSIHPGSPVLYKKVVVGSVQSYEFNSDNSGVDIKIFIENKYAGLVTKCSRFWKDRKSVV